MKIKNHEDLVRDPETGIIKNKNRTAFSNARKRKKEIIRKKEEEFLKDCRICDLEEQIKILSEQVKSLLGGSTTQVEEKPKTSRRKKPSEGVIENG